MLYGRYEEMRLKANKTSDNVFKHFSDERIWLKTILIFYKANIIQQASLTKNISAICWYFVAVCGPSRPFSYPRYSSNSRLSKCSSCSRHPCCPSYSRISRFSSDSSLLFC